MGVGGTEKKEGTQVQDRVLQEMKSFLPSVFSLDPAMNIM